MRQSVRWICACLMFAAGVGRAARAEEPLAVLVTGPLVGTVGEKVSFEVEIVNRSGQALQKLRVIDHFDSGFHHAASTSPIEQKGTIDLAAGTSRRLTLEFTLDEPGRQCHRVEIMDQAHTIVGGATACVQVAAAPAATPVPPSPIIAAPSTPAASSAGSSFTAPAAAAPLPVNTSVPAATAAPSLELGLTGPNDLVSGSMAQFIATIRNTGGATTTETSLDLSWDDGFSPVEASDGFTLGSSKVSWVLPAIAPGEQLRRQLNLKAQALPRNYSDSPPTRSCVRAVLAGGAGGVMVADESCVPIRATSPRPRTPREAGLRVSLADLDDPVSPGGTTRLICTVINTGIGPSGRINLAVLLPDQARLVGDPIPSRVQIDGSTISFDAVPSVPAGSQATFELAYRMPSGGRGKTTAIVTGEELDGSTEAVCETTFAGQ